jgi:hypothetical protein
MFAHTMPTAQVFFCNHNNGDSMAQIETDYLVIGAGATGLAFADTLLAHSDAHITFVDRRALPGGHWNDAYPFVTLHQPSAFYGVNSLPLGSGRKDTLGPNAGLYEQATGAEVCSYFQQVMQRQLLPSGRVHFLPLHECRGMEAGRAQAVSLLSGAVTEITVRRRVVDAAHFMPEVPATTPPAYRVAAGVRLLSPTQLAQLGQTGAEPPAGYCIVGAGKTAMDTGVWLLSQGVPAERIHWVVPRDAWLVNRVTTQPGAEFFGASMGGMLEQMRAFTAARDVPDLFLRLEASGQMLRIDPTQTPRMFHYATLAEAEVRLLRQITQVIRRGRVQAIEPDALVMDEGRVALPPGLVYVNCTASAVRARRNEPIFQPGRIVPQLVRVPLVTFSAAVCAYVEANYPDDTARNALCRPVPFPREVGGYVAATLVSQMNQLAWNQDKALREWMRGTRLDGFGKMIGEVDPDDAEKMAILARLKQCAMAAMGNVPRLMGAGSPPPRSPGGA